MSLLEVTNLDKSFVTHRDALGRVSEQYHAVKDVNFTVESGETFAIVGESGAGKSTTARLVLRLIEPSEGTIVFEGIDVRALSRKDLRQWRQRATMVFQDPYSSLDPRKTIGDSIAEPLVIFHKRTISRDERMNRATELLERVGLASRDRYKYPSQLSGGQLQRVAIARALSLQPSLIVCDEPVAALDMSIRAQVLNLMKDLQDEYGIALLFISHDLSLVKAIADKVAVMRHGEIVEQGPAAEIFESPSTDYTIELLNAAPVVGARAQA